jgi:tRNA threonylcarbamoyladenosine biosynthesis protein TsaB
MSLLLAVDASSACCSVSLLSEDNAWHFRDVQPRKQAQRILPMVDQAFQEAGVHKTQLSGVSYGRGPGSFTGIRIAASTIQGISLGLGVPVFGFSSLQVLAARAAAESGKTGVFAVMNAHMGEVFWGIFLVDSEGIPNGMGIERVGSPEECLRALEQFALSADELIDSSTNRAGSGMRDSIIAGDGIPLLIQYLNELPEAASGQSGKALEQRSSDLNQTRLQAGMNQTDLRYLLTFLSSGLSDCIPLTEFATAIVGRAWRHRSFSGFEQHGPVYLRDSVAWKKLDEQPSLLKR